MKTTLFDTLVPGPRTCKPGHGSLDLRRLNSVNTVYTNQPETEVTVLHNAVRECLGRQLKRTDNGPADVVFAMGKEGVAGRGPESYRLEISSTGIAISGSAARAVYWGIQTLRQVIEASGGRQAPCAVIEDWPAFGFRCYSDDISRRQVSTLKDFEFMIDNLSRLKYNYYQPYIEDVISIDRQPMLGFGRGRLTRDEIGALIEYGRRHFVEIMPQFNSVSHCEHMLSRPEYASWRFKGNLETLDPRSSDVRAFLRDVYCQMFEQFPCEYFHMGLDEARGLSQEPDLYVEHANWLAGLVLSAGKKPVMWHEMFVPYGGSATEKFYSPALLDRLNKEIVLDLWLYENNPKLAKFLYEMTGRGFKALLSPALRTAPCGDGSARQWKAASALLGYGIDQPLVLGVNNTSWNDSGLNDRFLHWRGHAVNARLIWGGPAKDEQRRRANRAFACQFLGIRDTKRADSLTAVTETAAAYSWLDRYGTEPPRSLAQGADRRRVSGAAAFLRKLPSLRTGLAAAKRLAKRNRDYLDHAVFGLERLRIGALRLRGSAGLAVALKKGDRPAIERRMATERGLVLKLRSGFAQIWLSRHKPEGLEHADLRFTAALSAIENLGWETGYHRGRSEELCRRGCVPLELGTAANLPAPDYAALPRGLCVLDNVPWNIAVPSVKTGVQFVALRAERLPEKPASVTIAVPGGGVAAVRFHALHTLQGKAEPGKTAAVYRLVFADGGSERIAVRYGLDVADQWMPFGHPYGGGGVHGLDASRCRLAFMTGPDAFQGCGLYHFQAAISRRGRPVTAVEVVSAGEGWGALVVAGVTLEKERP